MHVKPLFVGTLNFKRHGAERAINNFHTEESGKPEPGLYVWWDYLGVKRKENDTLKPLFINSERRKETERQSLAARFGS